jgi:hypothetical protein
MAVAGLAKSGFDGGFVDEHVRDVLFDFIDSVALRALQGLGVLTVFKGLFVCRADENIEEFLGEHGGYCTSSRGRNLNCRLMIVEF